MKTTPQQTRPGKGFRLGPGADYPHGPYTVPYGGRWVTPQWFRKFSSIPRTRTKRPKPEIQWTRFYLPAIPMAQDPEEVRLVNVFSSGGREFVKDMQDGYASMYPDTMLPTFFFKTAVAPAAPPSKPTEER